MVAKQVQVKCVCVCVCVKQHNQGTPLEAYLDCDKLSYTYVHLLVLISSLFVQCTVMDPLKLINVQQQILHMLNKTRRRNFLQQMPPFCLIKMEVQRVYNILSYTYVHLVM